MDMDILSFDRLIERAHQINRERVVEEAAIMRLAVGTAFSGDNKAFEKFVKEYTPEALREESKDGMIDTKSIRQLKDIFGG